MAGDYILPEDTVTTAPGHFEKILKIFIVVALIFFTGQLVWLFGIKAFKPFSVIDVSGFDGIGKDEILSSAGLSASSSFFSTDAAIVEKSLAGISYIESVKVIKHFPDRLQIVLESRKAVASALASLNGKTVPVLFDSEGVIFQIGRIEIAGSLPNHLPVISGLVIEDPVPGMKLPVMLIPLLRELEKIQFSSPELLSAVSELKVNRKSFEDFDFVLYPVHKKIKVRLSEINEDMLRYTLLMVDVLASKEDGIESLDFRSSIASYIPKEASSEQ